MIHRQRPNEPTWLEGLFNLHTDVLDALELQDGSPGRAVQYSFLSLVVGMARTSGVVDTSQGDLGLRLGISRDTVGRVERWLEDTGWIVRRREHGSRCIEAGPKLRNHAGSTDSSTGTGRTSRQPVTGQPTTPAGSSDTHIKGVRKKEAKSSELLDESLGSQIKLTRNQRLQVIERLDALRTEHADDAIQQWIASLTLRATAPNIDRPGAWLTRVMADESPSVPKASTVPAGPDVERLKALRARKARKSHDQVA